MKDREKTRRQLMDKLVELRKTLDELQESISEFQKSEERMQEKVIEYEKLSALCRLSANVAHEIRNPITVIGGLTERLKKFIADDAKGKEYFELISAEVKKLEAILKDALVFSDKAIFKREMQDIDAIINESLNAYEIKCEDLSIDVKSFLSDIPQMYIDGKQVGIAISNLILNAIEAMPDGGTLTVATAIESVGGKNYVAVKVIDTGIGISEENLTMIYEPFFSTKRTEDETGLGLPIARKIVEAHGGFIKVDSSVGRGSTFTLFFPYRAK
jgi:signal transduction histidine kinase